MPPIRWQGAVLGLVHLYSTDSAKPIDPDDLEFTLAVADTVAVALQNLNQRQELAENLNQIRRTRTSSCASSWACRARSSARARRCSE